MKHESAPVLALVGGGSGGHITPVLSVAREIKRLSPESRVIYIGQKGDQLSADVKGSVGIDKVYLISAGKFRRYHGESWLVRILDIKTIALNVRDFFLFLAGTAQSYRLLRKEKPAAIFIKGGFIGVPVGVSARLCHIPFLTHDSDAIAGLANRVIGRWAALHATGMPTKHYAYPRHRTVYTGVPVQESFFTVNDADKEIYRRKLGLRKDDQALLVVGGGLGSTAINELVIGAANELLDEYRDLHIFHVAGLQHQKAVEQAYNRTMHPREARRVHVIGFTKDLVQFAAVADIVIGRGGATHLAEMAALGKACIVIPHPQLTGGHQLKNTRYLEEDGAVIYFDQSATPVELVGVISELLKSEATRQTLASKLHSYAKPGVPAHIAKLTLGLISESAERS